MAYQIGKILQQDFGVSAIAVQVANESPDHGVHEYDLRMPMVSLADMENDIRADDILVVNPSFSNHWFGWRLPGFKLCYVQGFNTYPLLDLKFDHYVAVSDFVADYLRCTYAIDAHVIPPFVECAHVPEPRPWSARPSQVVLPYRKDHTGIWEHAWRALQNAVAGGGTDIRFEAPLVAGEISQAQLLERIGNARYLLTLSAAEGFGLVPLEAMVMGTLVVGFDGYGGRQYMRPNENCLVAPYPDIERVAELLIAAVENPDTSQRIAASGFATAQRYTYERFRQAWIAELQSALPETPAH